MKAKYILSLLLFLTGNMAAMAATKAYIEDFTATAGVEIEVPICLNTDLTDIDLIEGVIEFPTQLMVVDDAYGTNTRVKVDPDRASGFMGNFNPDNNTIKLQAVSSTLQAGNGAIAYMTLRVATNIPASCTVVLSSFKVRHKSGDYEDITTANAAVTGKAAPSATIALQCSPATLNLQSGQTGTVELKVQTTGNITGVQAVLTMSKGVIITHVEQGAVAGSPTIFSYNPSNGNFVYFGSMNDVSGAFLTFEVEASDDFSGSENITLSNIVATDATSVRITHDDVVLDVVDTPTSIETATTASSEDRNVYNLAGQRVNGSYKGIVIRKGKQIVVK